MRLRPIEQMGTNIADVLGGVDADTAAAIWGKLPGLRYQTRPGKVGGSDRAHARLWRRSRLRSLRPVDAEPVERFRQHMVNLRDYLKNNWSSLTNYGRARRHGRRISSAPAESGMGCFSTVRFTYRTYPPRTFTQEDFGESSTAEMSR